MIELKGYYTRKEEEVAIRSLLLSSIKGAKALLIEGVPGCGKTYLGECLANTKGWPLVFYQCHSWTTDQELFNGIDIVAAVKGDVENLVQDGALAAAAKKSISSKVVLIIDELDKAPERVDALLLDYLQSGRVPFGAGFIKANLDNLLVFITSNKVRELHPALLRRCRRLRMKPLPNDVLDKLISKTANIHEFLARKIRVICKGACSADEQESSLQEMVNLAEELKYAQSQEEVQISCEAWAIRGPKGQKWIHEKGIHIIEEIWKIISD